MSAALLDVEQLAVSFVGRAGARTVVADVSFQLEPGEAVGVVGESGSGKSLSMLSLLGLLPDGAHARAAHARFDGRDLLSLTTAQLNAIRGREIAIVFQDPLTALNPVLTIGRQITEVIRRHFPVSKAEASHRAEQLLARVGIPDPALRLRQYPHQFSGGMRQRVTIAMALAGEPRILIADEPTTALDVTVQAEIVGLIQSLQRQTGMGVIWVTHDLALLARIAERVLVMYGGRLVEDAPAEHVFASPRHPYTQALLSNLRPRTSLPAQSGSSHVQGALAFAEGASVSVHTGGDAAAVGCPFAPRCPQAMDKCRATAPPLVAISERVRVACWAVGPEEPMARSLTSAPPSLPSPSAPTSPQSRTSPPPSGTSSTSLPSPSLSPPSGTSPQSTTLSSSLPSPTSPDVASLPKP
jgi:oligopeptide/dipeptide ABC transporter ATP-binding protein